MSSKKKHLLRCLGVASRHLMVDVELYNDLFDSFFDANNIKRSMGILFQRKKNSVSDCISTVLRRIATDPVQLNFSEQGFCPFKNEPFLTITYDLMTKGQLENAVKILKHCDAEKKFVACSQMGVGASIFMLENESFHRHLDISLVMLGLYQLIVTSKQGIRQKVDVYNVMIQRLLKSVNVKPEAVLRARALCAEFDHAQNL